MPFLDEINYDILPEHIQESMRGYIEDGCPVGDFLSAVISDKLVESFARADDTNFKRMADFARFLYNQAPSLCWGSADKMKTWIEIGGLRGLRAKREEG